MDISQKNIGHSDPKVFQIGFNLCAATFLKRVFALNGYKSLLWHGGRLAEDIIYSKYAGEQPLKRWGDTTFFGCLESIHASNRPLLEAFKEIEFLNDSFPDAIFIFDTRNVDDWIEANLSHNSGNRHKIWVDRTDIGTPELLELWRNDWKTHSLKVFDFFDSNKRFYHFDCDAPSLKNFFTFLGSWFEINKHPRVELLKIPKNSSRHYRPLGKKPNAHNVVISRDRAFETSVADYCIGNIIFNNKSVERPDYSPIFAHWNGFKKITGSAGQDMPIVLGDDGNFHSKPLVENLSRVSETLNEIKRIGRKGEIFIDMQDARNFGITGISDIKNPTIVYNRRPKTTNLVLWPLPGYHTLGSKEFVHAFPIDRVEFDQKKDMAGWRGSINGKTIKELNPDVLENRISGVIVHDFLTATNDHEIEKYYQELMALTRFSLVSRSLFSENIDALLIYDKRLNPLRKHPLIKMLCTKRVPLNWFFKFKYILCLSGYDTASNFFAAANSNSVVLKEDDGWELFYTGEFKPWEHYIPLEKGALDVEEKLEWAKSNQSRCKEMSAASREVCAKFANRAARENILRSVFDAVTPHS